MLTKNQESILAELRKNSRQKLSVIAERIGIPNSTAHSAYKSMNDSIIRNASLLDFSRIGFSFRAIFILPTKNGECALHHKCVNSAWLVSGGNIMADCLFEGIAKAYEFKEAAERECGSCEIAMVHIIEELKKEKAII